MHARAKETNNRHARSKVHYFVASGHRPEQIKFSGSQKSEMHAGPKETNNRHASAKVHYFGASGHRPRRTDFSGSQKSEMHAGPKESNTVDTIQLIIWRCPTHSFPHAASAGCSVCLSPILGRLIRNARLLSGSSATAGGSKFFACSRILSECCFSFLFDSIYAGEVV